MDPPHPERSREPRAPQGRGCREGMWTVLPEGVSSGRGRRRIRESGSPEASRTLGPSGTATNGTDQPSSLHRAADAAVNAPNQSQGRGALPISQRPLALAQISARESRCPVVSPCLGPRSGEDARAFLPTLVRLSS